jgi:hypothetical protein
MGPLLGFPGTQRQVEALLSAPDRLDIVRSIRVPTVSITGEADALGTAVGGIATLLAANA